MKIFVYGTLKRGFGANRLLRDSQMVAEDYIDGAHMVSLGGFPGVFLSHREGTTGHVQGEVYEIDDVVLEHLDHYESNGSFYQRQKVTTRGGLEVEVYEFLSPSERYQPVPDGVWRRAG